MKLQCSYHKCVLAIITENFYASYYKDVQADEGMY